MFVKRRPQATPGTLTLAHGDASLRNVRTSSAGDVVLLDWEDVRLAPGAVDLGWLAVSSGDPSNGDAVLGDRTQGLDAAMPAALGQAVFALAGVEVGGIDAPGWMARIEAGAGVIGW